MSLSMLSLAKQVVYNPAISELRDSPYELTNSTNSGHESPSGEIDREAQWNALKDQRWGPQLSSDQSDDSTPEDRNWLSRFNALIGRDDPERTEPDTPQASAWREVVAHWTDSMRRQWGELANAQQDQGMTWQSAEWTAFKAIGRMYYYDPESRTYHAV